MYEDPPPDVTCVDLDTNTISNSNVRKTLKLNILPKKAAKMLRQSLEHLYRRIHQENWNAIITRNTQEFAPIEQDQKLGKRKRMLELDIQEAFLRFMCSILKGYESYLQPIKGIPSARSTDTGTLFDIAGFMKSRDKSGHEFHKLLMNTQCFIRFIEERSFLADKDAYLAFFDECAEKVDPHSDKIDQRLLEYEFSTESDHTLVVPPPETINPAQAITYDGFPRKLRSEFFEIDAIADAKKRSVPKPLVVAAAHGGEFMSLATRRTKQETKVAQKLARLQARTPMRWAKCLLSYAYSLWFVHLPAYVKQHPSKTKALRVGTTILDRMQSAKLPVLDEVCYRILMQLCFVYEQPVMAVKVFIELKRQGITPNATTYGFYNRAVLEAKWPSVPTLNAQRYWTKVRLVLRAMTLLRKALQEKRKQRRTLSVYSEASTESDFISKGGAETGSSITLEPDGQPLKPLPSAKEASEGYCSHLAADEGSQGSLAIAKKVSLTAQDLQNFDEKVKARKGATFVRRSIAQMGAKHGSVKCDSPAGLLMTSDLECIFAETTVKTEIAAVRVRRQSGGEENFLNRDQLTAEVSKFRQSAPEPKPSPGSGSLRNSLDLSAKNSSPPENRQSGILPFEGTKMGSDSGILQQISQNQKIGDQSDSACPLFEIPEEYAGTEKSDEIFAEHELETSRASSASPSKSLRVPVQVHDDPLSVFSDKDPLLPHAEFPSPAKKSMEPLCSSSPLKGLALDAKPFENEDSGSGEDEVDRPATPTNQSMFSGSGMRNLWNKFSQTPVGNLMRRAGDSLDSSPRTPENSNSQLLSSMQESPSFSANFSSIQAKVSSKVAQLRKQDSINRIKDRVTSVMSGWQNMRGNLEQIGSPLKSSLSSLSMELSLGAGDRGAFDDSVSLKDELGNADDLFEVPDDDPAFQLSTGETGSLWSFDMLSSRPAGSTPEVRMCSDGLEVVLSCCTRCPQPECGVLLYDDDILAGWSPDDSELNTKCQFCGLKLVPILNVRIRRIPSHQLQSASNAKVHNRQRIVGKTFLSRNFEPAESPKKATSAENLHDDELRRIAARNLQVQLSAEEAPKFGENSAAQKFPETIVTVPFLSPLVLRKELENVLTREGDDCLLRASFLETHPIIYWNLLYVYQRLSVPTHLTAWISQSKAVMEELNFLESGQNPANLAQIPANLVQIRCVYDIPEMHREDQTSVGRPLHEVWRTMETDAESSLLHALTIESRLVPKAVMIQMVDFLGLSNILKPLQLLLNEHRKKLKPGASPGALPLHLSMYRDLLFLALIAYGNDLDRDAFDREFQKALHALPPKIQTMLQRDDRPPSVTSRACRKIFLALDVC